MTNTPLVTCRSVLFDVKTNYFYYFLYLLFIIFILFLYYFYLLLFFFNFGFLLTFRGVPGRLRGVPGGSG